MRRLLLFSLLIAALFAMPAAASASGLQLDGVDDFVEAGADPTASDLTTARTWEAWVKTTSTGDQSIINRYRNVSGQESWLFDISNGIPRFDIWQPGMLSTDRYGSTTVNDGDWHHIAVVWPESQPPGGLDFYGVQRCTQ